MRAFVKGTFVLIASLAAFGIGFLIGRPLFARLAMLMVNEPMSNIDLYNTFLNGPGSLLGGLMFGALVGMAVCVVLERLTNRYGIPWLVPPESAEFEAGTIELAVSAAIVPEGGEAAERSTLFAQEVPALPLSAFMSQERNELTFRDGNGVELRLSRRGPSPYVGEKLAFAPILVTLRNRAGVLHSFEAGAPGRFWTPEAQYVSFCRFQLSYVGCEDELEATLMFKGMKSVMRRVFIED